MPGGGGSERDAIGEGAGALGADPLEERHDGQDIRGVGRDGRGGDLDGDDLGARGGDGGVERAEGNGGGGGGMGMDDVFVQLRSVDPVTSNRQRRNRNRTAVITPYHCQFVGLFVPLIELY